MTTYYDGDGRRRDDSDKPKPLAYDTDLQVRVGSAQPDTRPAVVIAGKVCGAVAWLGFLVFAYKVIELVMAS